jgi:hypothetical protein
MDKNYLKQKIQENKIKLLKSSNKKYPSAFQMAKNLGGDFLKNMKSVASGNALNVSTDVRDFRKSTCLACEFYDKQRDRCTKCGCNIAVKSYLRASSCPIGKW